jgi:hypothetical protein
LSPDFFFSFVALLSVAGGDGVSPPAAKAGLSEGAAINAIENTANTVSLVTILLMHRSCFPSGISLTRTFIETPARVEHSTSGIRGGLVARPGGYEHDDDVRIMKYEHDEDVMIMNKAHHAASGGVQRLPTRLVNMIDKPGHPDRSTS